MPNLTPPPVPTQQAMTNTQGLATRPWIAWFTTLGQIFGFNQTIQAAGIAVPQEIALNFLAPLTVTDNPTKGSTDIGIATAPSVKQTIISVTFGSIYQNTGTTAQRIYLYVQAASSSAGTAFVYSDETSSPTTQIALASAASGGSPVTVALPFEVMPGNYVKVTQDTGSLSIQLAVEVQ